MEHERNWKKKKGKSERQGREEEMRKDKYEKRGTDNEDKEKEAIS